MIQALRKAGPALLIAAILAGLFASFALWAGFQDNNQGEFFDTVTGVIDWPYSLLLWLSWFAPIFAVIAFLGLVARFAFRGD